MPPRRFDFAFDRRYLLAGAPFGVLPRTTYAEVDGDRLHVRFGPWSLTTPVANVAALTRTGGYAFVKTAGPPHLSLADRGITFATNGRAGVCVRFHEPVRVYDPTGRLRHPGVTLTLADLDGFIAALGPPPPD